MCDMLLCLGDLSAPEPMGLVMVVGLGSGHAASAGGLMSVVTVLLPVWTFLSILNLAVLI